MVQPHRALATFVYLAAIAGTLAVAFSVSSLVKQPLFSITSASLPSAAAVRTVDSPGSSTTGKSHNFSSTQAPNAVTALLDVSGLAWPVMHWFALMHLCAPALLALTSHNSTHSTLCVLTCLCNLCR
jgi:hypothetical protein